MKANTIFLENNGIQVFNNEKFGSIRTQILDGQVWFVGKDVATILGYSNPNDAIKKRVDDEDKGVANCDTLGGNQNMTVINESGLYSLILSSKLPQAKEFKHWVTSVVLPQIRKTGGYIPVDKEDDEKAILCKAIMIYKRTLEEKDHLLEEQKPKVIFADAVTSQDDSILIRDLAKLITQNGVNIGQARLFYWLRLHGYLFQKETRPIQKWVEKGLFDTNITLVETHHGTKERCTTKVTGKGQEYFVNGFISGRFHAENGNM